MILKIIIYPSGVIVFYYMSLYLENLKLLNIIGEYSFCIYVLHEPVILSNLGRAIDMIGLYNAWILVPIISCIGILICILLYKSMLIFNLGRIFWNKKE